MRLMWNTLHNNSLTFISGPKMVAMIAYAKMAWLPAGSFDASLMAVCMTSTRRARRHLRMDANLKVVTFLIRLHTYFAHIFQGTYRYDGEVFTAQDGCNRCWCNKGEIICPFEDDCQNAVARRRAFE